MKIETPTCKVTKQCDNTRRTIPLQVAKSVNVRRINTLHQFDDIGIVGLQSPVGKVPIVFYVKDSCTGGRRGILYYDDLDTVNFMYPEDEHAEWCSTPYDLKYDAVEDYDNGVERGKKRNHGIFELWVDVYRKWYNGRIAYKPNLRIQGCGGSDGGYPRVTKETKEEQHVSNATKTQKMQVTKVKKTTPSCGCGK